MNRAVWILLVAVVALAVGATGYWLGRGSVQPGEADASNAAAPVANAVAPAAKPPGAATANAQAAAPPPAVVSGIPTRIGECAMTEVEWVGTRLEDENDQPIEDSGSAVRLRNGVYGVSYEQQPAVDRSRIGDPVRTCLVSIPEDCPPGDDRGREYHTTNLRTNQEWTLPDAEHFCGGA